jgi:hypothetical protein
LLDAVGMSHLCTGTDIPIGTRAAISLNHCLMRSEAMIMPAVIVSG